MDKKYFKTLDDVKNACDKKQKVFWAHEGMNMEILNTDYTKYVDKEIKWYKNHRDCFVSDFNLDDDDTHDSIIENLIHFRYVEADDYYYKEFIEDNNAKLEDEFSKYIGKRLNAKGINLDWRHSSGEASFILEDVKDIEYKLLPNCDKHFSIDKVDDNRYLLKCFHHDCPTGTYINFNFS